MNEKQQGFRVGNQLSAIESIRLAGIALTFAGMVAFVLRRTAVKRPSLDVAGLNQQAWQEIDLDHIAQESAENTHDDSVGTTIIDLPLPPQTESSKEPTQQTG